MPRRRPSPSDPKSQVTTGEPEPTAPEADPSAHEATGERKSPGASGWTPRDMLVPYVLLAVSLQRAHGYLIEEYLRGLGFWGLEMSTLYRTLRQLEKDGLLQSSWTSGPAGPARRVYTLTDVGRTWLDSWAGALDTYRGMIDRFFGLYQGMRPPSIQDEEDTQR